MKAKIELMAMPKKCPKCGQRHRYIYEKVGNKIRLIAKNGKEICDFAENSYTWAKVKINGHEVNLLVDTGSAFIMLRPKTAKNIGLQPEFGYDKIVPFVGEKGATPCGTAVAEIKIGHRKINSLVAVIDTRHEVLGNLALIQFEAIIDIKKKKLIVR